MPFSPQKSWPISGLLLALLCSGCLDLDASPPECFPDDGCAGGAVCVEGRCAAIDSPALLFSTECLGAVGDACDQSISARVGAQSDNACLVAEVDGTTTVTSLRWRGELTANRGTPRVARVADAQVQATVFFLSDGAGDRCDASLTLETECAADFCVARLEAEPVLMPSSGDVTLDFFSDRGRCALSWAGEPPVDDCDGQDQDCDAAIDEGTPELGDVCLEGLGVCAAEGVVVCERAGARCTAAIGAPREELLNELDDDCDGLVDEDVQAGCQPGDVQVCGLALGVCVEGVRRCAADADFGPCLDMAGAAVPMPTDETCDGFDEDCDGSTDEGLGLTPEGPFVGEPCTVGLGSCAVNGLVVCGEIGAPVCNALPGQPRAERCDGFDDDCDGNTDEGFELGAACEDGVGACFRAGELVCAADVATCSVVAGPPGEEACSTGVDEDCDGAVDEGYESLGAPCTAGLGVCQVAGQQICDVNAPTQLTCDIEALQGTEEICNRLDDDCDGEVDEAFDLTSDAAHCGRCDQACDLPGAVSDCADSACVISNCGPGFVDLDEDPANGCECQPDADDLPDPQFQDVNCDGVDGDVESAVFVSVASGNDAHAGTIDAPVQTLPAAVALLAEGRMSIYLDAGRYPLERTGNVPSGVGLYGGYLYDGDRTWLRAGRAQAETLVSGPALALMFRELTGPTHLENLVVESADAPAGRSSVAIVVVGGGEHLSLVDVTIRSGAGGRGVGGVAGEQASPAGRSPGEAGLPSASLGCQGCPGAGGENVVCEGANGGDGGHGNGFVAPQPGDGGSAPGGESEPGEPGARGGDGANGAPGGVGGQIADDGRWRPTAAADGQIGTPGGGGGGGGAGAVANIAQPGGGGGGGGAGGCPGAPGSGGGGGGASIALQVFGGTVTLQRVLLRPGRGGDGGGAGAAGLGATGANGGAGGNGCPDCGDGGDGGEGGDGGCGGHGAPGSGGPSVSILRVGDASVARFVDDAGEPTEPQGLGVSANGQPGAAATRATCTDGLVGLPVEAMTMVCCTPDQDNRCVTFERCEP